ncbi:MAG TPA: ParB/RepB/Spo0J family partition protein [Pyrinomonadaceae bacterium]|jgi:ParB family chromosome partitioning protein|nr:ParB/RepB/Spo0J family partition protein [Pyrinomonadaceae bacterium]
MRHDAHYVEAIAHSSRAIGKTIGIDLIEPNPEQPRTEFGDLKELSASIKEKGVLEPLLVKVKPEGGWMIIAGERRWRASKLAGLTEVPCIEIDTDEQGIAEIALIENLQRKDLNIWEESDGLAALAGKFGYTQDEIAQKISKSRSTVTELMTIAGLPEDVRLRCREANISSKSTLLEIARQFDDAAMHQFLDALQKGEITPRSKQPRPSVSKTERPQAELIPTTATETNGYTFSFAGNDPNFNLIVTFENAESATRGEILRALKQAFDSVKAASVSS